MSIRYLPEPSQLDHAAAHHEERRRRALRRLDVSDVLAELDDLIAAEPDERNHPLFPLAEFLLDRRTSVDGAGLYDTCRALVLRAIDRCVADALAQED